MLKNGAYNKIIITRPLISVDEENVGFLPGNLVNKMQPWMQPIIDIFAEYYSKQYVNSMISNGVIEISPLAYMRGRTFKDAFIIADEMQNCSPNQMLMMTTRVGKNSRLVITGDLKQTDRAGVNGLQDFINKLKKYNNSQQNQMKEIDIVELNENDIERSPLVSKIMEIYNFVPLIDKNDLNDIDTEILTNKNEKNLLVSIDKQLKNLTDTRKTHDNGNTDAALIPKSYFYSKNNNV
jgi:phosphate starvation-inducible PhoH-like protein